MNKEIKLFQNVGFKLVGARDMDPREVLPGAPGDNSVRTSEEDPSIGDIARVSDEAATVVYIEGYASVFVNPDGSRLADRDGESVSIALLDIDNYKKNPILVYNHDWGDVAGKITSIEKDELGLYIKAEVHKFTGREQVFEAVQKGIVISFSIGFVAKRFTYLEEEDIFEISSAELVEISLAPVPSNQDALFVATSQKSLKLDKEMVKTQTKMTCDELNGICSMNKTIKGREMLDITTKEVAPVVVEPVVTPVAAEPVVAPVATEPVKAPVVAEPVNTPALASVDDVAKAIAAANEEIEAKKVEKAAADAAEKAAIEKAEKDAAEKRIVDSFDYIRERKAAIEATDSADLDVDELADLYELMSDTVELINSKVTEAASAA